MKAARDRLFKPAKRSAAINVFRWRRHRGESMALAYFRAVFACGVPRARHNAARYIVRMSRKEGGAA